MDKTSKIKIYHLTENFSIVTLLNAEKKSKDNKDNEHFKYK